MSIREATHTRPAHYFAFDILRYQGKDVRALPLAERKRLLEAALAGNHYFSPAIAVEGSGIALFEALKGKGLEGIVAKRLNSSYVGQRDENWQKIDYYDHAVVQIVGYRKNQFGWLMQQRDRRVGLLENGVPSAHKNAFHGVCNRIKTGEDRDFVYVEPSIEARVRFRRRNAAGRLSDPEFVDFVVS
jgi:DNA ligase-1